MARVEEQLAGANVTPRSATYQAWRSREPRRRMSDFMRAAIAEAEAGRDEGGIPIGSVLVLDRASTLYTTLSPCAMCSGASLQDERCIELMTAFIAARPDLWYEDIGEVVGEP
jgi:cytosine deaminase